MTAKTGRGHSWTARLLTAAAAAGIAAAAAGTALASQPDRISLPYSCKIEHGRLRLDPAPAQVYQLTGGRDQRAFTYCLERQSCQTVAVHRFTISCGGQRAPWADIVSALAERGHPRFAVVHGRLGLLARPRFAARAAQPPAPASPANRILGGWCSDQFGGPTQPFLRQACNQARRFASNLGGPSAAAPARQPGSASPQFVALPQGFAPLGDADARLLPPVAVALAHAPEPSVPAPPPAATRPDGGISEAAAVQAPALSAPEPNDRTSGAAPPRRPAWPESSSNAMTAERASAWITSVHLASATVAASSEAAAERQRASGREQNTSFMMILAGVLASAAALLAVTLRRNHRLRRAPAATPRGSTPLARLSAPDGGISASHAPAATAALWRAGGPLQRRFSRRLAGLRGRVHTVLAQTRHRSLSAAPLRQRPPATAEHQAAVAALPAEARLIMTAREQAADRIADLRQAIAPLARTAPSLQAALARDLMAGERRLAKITVASLSAADRATASADNTQEQDAARKRGQSRLQRVTADLDRLQAIIAGAVASLTRETSPRQLPRDVSEAHAALGVSAGAPEATLKKLVDALRVSWHPDLATSDEDRAHRNERIKEINVAWDLIAGKRAAE